MFSVVSVLQSVVLTRGSRMTIAHEMVGWYEFRLCEPLQLSMEEICRDIFLAYRQEKCHDKFFPFVYMF